MASPMEVAAASLWLDVWERAAGQPASARAETLLRPVLGEQEVVSPSLGARDALLLELRGALFGQELECTASCPECGERCEWECTLESMRAGPASTTDETFDVCDGPWQVRVRRVDAGDLAAVTHCTVEADALRELLARCVLSATCQGETARSSQLPESMVEAISNALAAADPQAATTVGLHCPACGHRWDAAFDAGAYLWTELDSWAQRTLGDVHVLASRYGWTEREILSLPATRRARYLAMALA
jgi:hypothetical protein